MPELLDRFCVAAGTNAGPLSKRVSVVPTTTLSRSTPTTVVRSWSPMTPRPPASPEVHTRSPRVLACHQLEAVELLEQHIAELELDLARHQMGVVDVRESGVTYHPPRYGTD